MVVKQCCGDKQRKLSSGSLEPQVSDFVADVVRQKCSENRVTNVVSAELNSHMTIDNNRCPIVTSFPPMIKQTKHERKTKYAGEKLGDFIDQKMAGKETDKLDHSSISAFSWFELEHPAIKLEDIEKYLVKYVLYFINLRNSAPNIGIILAYAKIYVGLMYSRLVS